MGGFWVPNIMGLVSQIPEDTFSPKKKKENDNYDQNWLKKKSVPLKDLPTECWNNQTEAFTNFQTKNSIRCRQEIPK